MSRSFECIHKITKKSKYNKVNRLLSAILIIAFSISCNTNDPAPSDPEAGLKVVDFEKTKEFSQLENQYSTLNQAIYFSFRDWYLWNTSIPKSYPYQNYDPERLIDNLRYEDRDSNYADIFSFITSKVESRALFDEGNVLGKGLDFSLDPRDTSLRVTFVYKTSPAASAGLYRGVKVAALNGKAMREWIFGDLDAFVNALYGETAEYTFVDTNGVQTKRTLTSGNIVINTVLHSSIKNIGGKKIGYLVFNSFINTSKQELTNAFASFSSQAIDELVLDLRYNGGGLVDVAEFLGSMIVGEKGKDQVFFTYKFNKDHSAENQEIKFDPSVSNKLNIARIFIITTPFTASASELIINGLKPYLQVIQIGDDSYGKPVGFFPFTFKDYEIYPVSFETVNKIGSGRYFNGFQPNYYEVDGLFYDWGNEKEPCLHQALYFINNNRFDSEFTKSTLRADAKDKILKMPQKKGMYKIVGCR